MDRELQALILVTVDNARRQIEAIAPLVVRARQLAGKNGRPLSLAKTAELLPSWTNVALHYFEKGKWIPTDEQLVELLGFIDRMGVSN